MPSGYPHAHANDLFVSYSTRDLDWVRVFHDDLVADINRFADPDVFPFLDKARPPGYLWKTAVARLSGPLECVGEQFLAGSQAMQTPSGVFPPLDSLQDSEEQTNEVVVVTQKAKTGADYIGVSFILATPKELHYDLEDDDRCAVTFWGTNREDLLKLLYRATEELEKSK